MVLNLIGFVDSCNSLVIKDLRLSAARKGTIPSTVDPCPPLAFSARGKAMLICTLRSAVPFTALQRGPSQPRNLAFRQIRTLPPGCDWMVGVQGKAHGVSVGLWGSGRG